MQLHILHNPTNKEAMSFHRLVAYGMKHLKYRKVLDLTVRKDILFGISGIYHDSSTVE